MRDAYDIVMLVPGMAFDGSTDKEKSLGGSETAGLCMARELSKMGHRVMVFSNTDEISTHDGVVYMPQERWELYSKTTPHDINIVQRSPASFQSRLASKVNILWQHDMAMGRVRDHFKAPSWNIDRAMVLSEYMRKQYCDVYGYEMDDDIWWQTRNGIDLELIEEAPGGIRDHKHLIYAARPERGLDVLLDEIMPALWERDPEFTLTVYGYDNEVTHLGGFYGALAEQMDEMGDRVKHGGHLKKAGLYAVHKAAGVYVYPTPSPIAADFREISCISAMEVQACGLPIVTSAIGALPETIAKGAGTLVKLGDDYVEKFVDAIIGYATDKEKFNKASKAGIKAAQKMSWASVAEEWTEGFDELFDTFNDDPVRLAHHFYKRSDIFAAYEALEGQTSLGATNLRKLMDEKYPFIDSDEAHAEHYLINGRDTTARLEAHDPVPEMFDGSKERRFQDVASRLRWELQDEDEVLQPFTMLEYGCGHGWSSIYYANELGCALTGVDVDPGAIASCKRYAPEFARDPSILTFVEGDGSELTGQYDVLLVGEVLEHVLDPVALMTRLEKLVKPGGLVLVTTPYGPSEIGTPNWEIFRNHIWEFELQDLSDMFKGKPHLAIDGAPERVCPVNGDAVGYHLTWFQANHEPIQPINLERKMRLQRPRLTVSANIIAGPGAEKSILWGIDSVKDLVDEIVITDTGLSDLAKVMLYQQPSVRVVKGSDPIKHGFETPRNEALDASWTDMILWFDTDEKVIDAQNLTKYMRKSHWSGFGIKQHHFSVDTDFPPDLPVRLFDRKAVVKGEPIRFYGMIHEHPEAGMNNGPGRVLVISDVNIAHTGYLSENVRRQRFGRNAPLVRMDQETYPDRLLQKHFVIRDMCLLNRYQYQGNGGQVNAEMAQRAREACAMYKEHFHIQTKLVGIDTLKYYTECLVLLGEGLDVSFDLNVNRDGIGDVINGHGTHARFASAAEAIEEITHRTEQKFERFQKEW
jgi:glycosyltransferase involved in cell wall biosynthesis/SAM-dependent methyltransferase